MTIIVNKKIRINFFNEPKTFYFFPTLEVSMMYNFIIRIFFGTFEIAFLYNKQGFPSMPKERIINEINKMLK